MAAVAAAGAAVAAAVALVAVEMGQASIQLAQMSKEISRNASAASISTETYQELSYAVSKFGGDNQDLQDMLGTLADRAADATAGVQSMADDFALVGLEIDELLGRSPEQLFRAFAEGVQETTDPTKRMAAAARLLGDDLARKMLPMLMQGAEGLDKFAQRARDLGVVIDEDTLAQSKLLSSALGDLKTAYQGLWNQLGRPLTPVLIPLFEELAELLAFVSSGLKSFIDVFIDVEGTATEALSSTVREFRAVEQSASDAKAAVSEFEKSLGTLATKGAGGVAAENAIVVERVKRTEAISRAQFWAEQMNWSEEQLRAKIADINALYYERTDAIKAQWEGLGRSLTALEKENAVLRLRNQAAMAASEAERIKLQFQADSVALMVQYSKLQAETSDELVRSAQMDQLRLKTKALEIQKEEELAALRAKNNGSEDAGNPLADISAIVSSAQSGAEDATASKAAEEELRARRAEAIDHRNAIAALKLQAVLATTEAQKAEIERAQKLLAIDHARASGAVTAGEAEFARAKTLAEFQAEQHRIAKERRAEEFDHIRELREQWVSAAAQIGSALDSVGGLSGFGDLAGDIGGVVAGFQQMRKEGAGVADALTSSMGAGAAAIAKFAKEQGASRRALNVLMAATATAQGFLAASYGNIPASISAFTAAAIYGANAIGGGSSGGASASAGASAGSSRRPGITEEQAFNMAYSAHLKALKDARDESKSSTMYNFAGATFLDGNIAAQRRVNEATSRSRRLNLGGN
jgi:hypothetical protein